MNWHTPSLTTSFQFRPACNSRPWNEAIGMQLEEEEGRLLKYIPVHFSPDQRDFFFYRDPWVPPDTSTAFCIVFTRIIWYIGLFLSPSLSLCLFLSLLFACGGTLCDQRRNHRAWISTRYRLSLGRQRIDDEPIKFIIFAGKAEQVDVSKRDPRVDCGYLPDDCSFRYTKQLSDCFHAFAWSLKRIYACIYI